MARILVVEDDADLRAELMDALCLFEHDVIGAEDGLKALEMLKTEVVDLVIADHRMPRLSGTEMIGLMRASPELASIPVIMVSAVNPSLPESDRNRPTVFLSKPPDIDVLAETIISVLS